MLKNLAIIHIASEIDEKVIKKDQNSFENELKTLKSILFGKEGPILPEFIKEYRRKFHQYIEENHSDDLKSRFYEQVKYHYVDKQTIISALKRFELEVIRKSDLKIQEKEILFGSILNEQILHNGFDQVPDVNFCDSLKNKIRQSILQFKKDKTKKMFLKLNAYELDNILSLLIRDINPQEAIQKFLSATTIEVFRLNRDGEFNMDEALSHIFDDLSKKLGQTNNSLENQINYHWHILIDRLLNTVVEYESLSNYIHLDSIRIPISRKLDEIEHGLLGIRKDVNLNGLGSFKGYVSKNLDFGNESFKSHIELKDFIQKEFRNKGSCLDIFLEKRNQYAELISGMNISALQLEINESDFTSEGIIERINNFTLMLKTHPINSLKITIKDPLIQDITINEIISSNGLWNQIRKQSLDYIKNLKESILEIDNKTILNYSKMGNSPLVEKLIHLAEIKIDQKTVMLDRFNISLIDREKNGDLKSLFRLGLMKAIKFAVLPSLGIMEVVLDTAGEFVGFLSDDGKITKKKNSELNEYLDELKQEYVEELEKILREKFQI